MSVMSGLLAWAGLLFVSGRTRFGTGYGGMDAAEFVQAIRLRLETPALLFVE